MVSVLGFQEASCSLLDLNQAKLNMMVYLGRARGGSLESRRFNLLKNKNREKEK